LPIQAVAKALSRAFLKSCQTALVLVVSVIFTAKNAKSAKKNKKAKSLSVKSAQGGVPPPRTVIEHFSDSNFAGFAVHYFRISTEIADSKKSVKRCHFPGFCYTIIGNG
jgi:hypothetical protein